MEEAGLVFMVQLRLSDLRRCRRGRAQGQAHSSSSSSSTTTAHQLHHAPTCAPKSFPPHMLLPPPARLRPLARLGVASGSGAGRVRENLLAGRGFCRSFRNRDLQGEGETVGHAMDVCGTGTHTRHSGATVTVFHVFETHAQLSQFFMCLRLMRNCHSFSCVSQLSTHPESRQREKQDDRSRNFPLYWVTPNSGIPRGVCCCEPVAVPKHNPLHEAKT